MDGRNDFDFPILLEDYGTSVARRAQAAAATQLPRSDRPLWLRVEDFGRRVRWQFRQPGSVPGPSATPPPALLAERFDPFRRYRETPGTGIYPVDEATRLELETRWSEESFRQRAQSALVPSLALHAVLAAYLLTPGTLELDLTEPADWSTLRITLMAPPLDDLPPLKGQPIVPGEGDDGFRGLPEPVSIPPPVAPQAEVAPPVPEPEAEAPVAQPLEDAEPDPPDEPPALEEAPAESPEEPPAEEAPEARSPEPGEFRAGRELAERRDPRLLPMPSAPARKRPVLELENPKARMPSRQGDAQLGSLEFDARPDQVIQGAIQQMIRGGGARQAVGDGIGALPSAGALPPGPSNSGSLVELLSDPRGVDFRPYLTQVLAAVRRNWFAVIPESARLGMSRGRTQIQFSVARSGSVPKLVIATPSGTPPLDRAAVAGISASNPFPPLPGEFTGDSIRLQFTFLYNIRNP